MVILKEEVSWGDMSVQADESELAGPPVGYLPAGMQPTVTSPSQAARSNISPASAHTSPKGQGQSQYMASGSVNGSGQYTQTGTGSMWGEASNVPRARYDGSKSIILEKSNTDDRTWWRTCSG